jgi:hypothetical protein
VFFGGKVFSEFENGQNKCPKTKRGKKFPQNTCFRCIIEIYGLAAKKIILGL